MPHTSARICTPTGPITGPPRPTVGPSSERYTSGALLRDLPPGARWFIVTIIMLAGVALAVLGPRANITPVLPLLLLVLLSSLTSAFKVQLPIASGSSMSVSYVVDIAALILRGPHTAMTKRMYQRARAGRSRSKTSPSITVLTRFKHLFYTSV